VRAEQQLQSLNALGDHVTQKLHSLEHQGEVVDRAAAQAARLDDLVWEIDSRMKKVEKDGRQISKTQKTLKNLHELSTETVAQLQ
jgi:prefoldin subunit 5